MDFAAHVEDLLAFYVRMAKTHPAWRKYAEERVKYLAEKMPSMYGQLPARLAEAMRSASQSPSEPSAPSMSANTGGQGTGA